VTTKLSESEKKKEDWMNSKWRPMMGWMYMVVCTMDMVVFPILWSLLQTFTHTQITQWNPLTLQGAGLFHIAMGAVLGIAAFGRTQEKLNGANNGGLQAPGAATSSPTFGVPPAATNSWSSQPLGSGSSFRSTPTAPAASWGTTPIADSTEVVTGFGGKPAPVIPPFPER
jgi:hypothetical protein